MHNLVPHFIQENIQRGVYRGEFSAVGLFLDISGFSTITDTLMEHGPYGAEVLAAMMRSVLDPLATSVYAHGGFIATLAGDAFTALFSLESSQAEGCLHALAAAWQAQAHMADNAEQQTPFGSFRLQAKVGLAVGEVGWSTVFSPDRRRAVYYFQGTAVGGCAQAEHLAQAGEIILDAASMAQVKEWIKAEPRDGYHRLTQVTGALPPPRSVQLPPPDPEVMALFFPDAPLSQALSGEFRQVVNLFISLPTVRTEAQLTIFIQTLFELQDRYGGLLNKLDFGDKGSNLLLFWGAPLAYENDIERALNFILSLQPLTSIPINAGMTYQIAHAGFIGSALLEEYTCYGKGVNLAARLMSSAPRGEIWVDENIARRAREGFELEFEGEMAYKGFAEKQKVYILHDRKEQAESIYPGELVGRGAELNQLQAFVAPLWQSGYAGALVVSGDPGIGKSHLVHAFRTSQIFQQHPVLWALCQTDAILRQPLNPFRYWLRRYFGHSDMFTEARNKRSFNLKLDKLIEDTLQVDAKLSDELDRVRSCLGALVDLNWPDSLYEQLDPPGRYENTLIALTALLQAESLRQPVVVLLEDAHWLDGDSQTFLSHLERALTSDESKFYPIAIIATTRGEGIEHPLGHELACQVMALPGLSGEDLHRLAEQVLGGSPSPQLLGLLGERAEGNPFFAEQILHYLREEGLLELTPSGWGVTGPAKQPPMPADVRAVLVARLDRLGQEVKEVVQTASILGREFEVQLLAHMLQHDERLFQKMEIATQASIWTALNELRYLFKHALLHDAAYRTLVRAHQRSLHGLAVNVMESLYAGDMNLHYGELAYHSEQAGLIDKARRYLQLAGDFTRDVYENNQAVDYYSRALSLTPENDPEARYRLLMCREAVYTLLGDRQGREQDLQALARLAEALDTLAEPRGHGPRQADVGERWASYTNQIGDYAGAAAAAEKAVALARAANATDVAVRAHLTWSNTLWKQGIYEAAIRQAEEGLVLARQIEDRREQCRALNMLGLIALEQGDAATVRQYLEQALRVAQESGNRRIEHASLNNLGNLAGGLGNFSEAKEYYEKALRTAREIGDRTPEGIMLGNLGWVIGTLGDYATARLYSEQNLRIAREVGDRHTETYALLNLSSFSGRQGDHGAALAYADQSLAMARQAGDSSGEAWALTYAGHAHFGLGQSQAAAQSYQGGLEIRRALNQANLATEPLAGLARLALAGGDLSTARARIEAILAHLDRGGTLDGTDEPLRVYLTCYQVLLAGGDPLAVKTLETACSLLQERAARISDADMRSAYVENVPYHREVLAAWEARLNQTQSGDLPA